MLITECNKQRSCILEQLQKEVCRICSLNSVVMVAYGDENTNNRVLGVEGEECAEWGGFGSQGIGIVLCDRA